MVKALFQIIYLPFMAYILFCLCGLTLTSSLAHSLAEEFNFHEYRY